MTRQDPPEVRIRAARSGDVAEVERLWQLLIEHQQELEPRLRFVPDAIDRWRADIGHWLRSESKRVWVAEESDRLLGFLTAERSYAQAMFAARLDVLISEIFVMDSHRGQGLGSRMLSSARDWAEEIGASGVTANVLAANDSGRRFWANAGAEPFFETTVIQLKDEEPDHVDVSREIGFGNL